MIHFYNINDGDDAPSAGCPSVGYHGAVSQQIGFYPWCVTVVSKLVFYAQSTGAVTVVVVIIMIHRSNDSDGDDSPSSGSLIFGFHRAVSEQRG